MIARFLPRIGQRYQRSLVLAGGSIFIYELHKRRTILRNDSGTGVDWPPIQTIELKSGKVGSSVLQKPVDGAENKERSWFGNDDNAAWTLFSSSINAAGASIASIEWSTIGDTITDYILPEWAKGIPGYVMKLQAELEMAPGSLADEIWQEADNSFINPEITRTARVRIGKELCWEEKTFQERRRVYTTQALARYLDIPEKDVDPEDVPTIAMCGSGGGLRAVVAGTGSYLSAQEAGLFDCVTYTAGVSGSCWLQTLYYSSLSGQRHDRLIEHLKRRIGVHIAFPPPALNLLTSAPTNKFLLSGLVEKLRGDPDAEFGIVDAYGLLLAARLLVPRGELGVEARDLKLSNQRDSIDDGSHPLPIYTAVRHEIPLEEYKSIKEDLSGSASESTKEKAKQESWFQWFEFTPYEFWCEELDAGIPTWSLGRQFSNGIDVPRSNGLGLPELRIPQLLGIFGSAFCATLSHYYKEVQPLVKGVAVFGGIDSLIEERNDDLIKVHPIVPASIPNFAQGLEGQLSPTCPQSIYTSTHLQLMDAGMSNNLPIYPLLRPGRDVDILIAFDASADIKTENWLSVADGYAKQRGVKGWPVGLGWPKEETSKQETQQELEVAQASTAQEATIKVAEAREQQREENNLTQGAVAEGKTVSPASADLGYCTVWIGTTAERSTSPESPTSKRVNPDADWELITPDAGIAVVYFPFLPNPKVEGVDPNTSDFMSTWNFVYTPEQIDKVVALARANFEEGKEQTKRCVRAVYERKRNARWAREAKERAERWRRRLKSHGNHFAG
jgi:phospholipase A2